MIPKINIIWKNIKLLFDKIPKMDPQITFYKIRAYLEPKRERVVSREELERTRP